MPILERWEAGKLLCNSLNQSPKVVQRKEDCRKLNATAGDVRVSSVRTLFTVSALGGYDVAADGQKFIIAQGSEKTSTFLTIVTNWSAELRK